MKTTEFIVEYAGIGEDAEAMAADNEVQLARQQCYHAARDAISLHHILKDVSEQEGLEGWVSEKLTQAASNLNDVIEHLEGLRGGDGEEGMEEIMQAFSFESAEALYGEMLEEGTSDDRTFGQKIADKLMGAAPRVPKYKVGDYVKYETDMPQQHWKDGGRGKGVITAYTNGHYIVNGNPINHFDIKASKPSVAQEGNAIKRGLGEGPANDRLKAHAGALIKKLTSPVKDPILDKMKDITDTANKRAHDAQNKKYASKTTEGQVNELDASTMQAYLNKRKDSPMPGTMHKAGVQAAGVRNAKEKIHDKGVTKAAKQTGRIQDMDEGRWVKGPGGVPLDRQGNPKVPKLAPMKAIRAPAQPKLTLNDVWRQVENVVGQIFPDGDPIDWMAPWLEKRGYKGWEIGEIIDRAAKANGYKDMYDYWDQLKADMDADAAYDAQMGESQVNELSKNTLQSYRAKATKSEHNAEQNNNGDQADKRLAGRNSATARLNGLSKAPSGYKEPVKENASAGGTSAGAMAAGPTGAANKPGTGKPKKVANMVKRTNPTVGKGIY